MVNSHYLLLLPRLNTLFYFWMLAIDLLKLNFLCLIGAVPLVGSAVKYFLII